jgi:hypothetical protein
MIVEILFAVFIFVSYFLFYVEYKINKHNEIYKYEKELTRQNINNDILLKMPFYFDASHLNRPMNINNYKLIKKDKSNKAKEYNSIAENELLLLKPYIKSNIMNKIYSIKGGGVFDIHTNFESVNYYFVRDGTVEIFLIHPKFKDNFKPDEKSNKKEMKHYIENNTHFHNVKCTKGTIVYVPNKWIVYIKNNEKDVSWIEKLTYSTMVNKFMLYFKKNT